MQTPPRLTIAGLLAAVTLFALTLFALTANLIASQPNASQPNASQPNDPQPDASQPNDPQPKDSPAKDEEAAPASPAEIDTSAKAALARARQRLMELKSLEAELVETVSIEDRRFSAKGRYVQGTNLRLRLEYTLMVGETSGTLLQVCDGQVLWTQTTVADQSRITRRDVRQILQAAADHLPQSILEASLGLGGLPALLASLEKTMTFDRLTEETIDGTQFLVIEGTWKDEFIRDWKIDEKPAELPAHVPDRVRVYLDKQEDVPRRIEYRKRPPGEDYTKPMVKLDFKQILLNPTIRDDAFQYVPPDGVFQEDVTKQYIERLRQQAGNAPATP